MNRVRTTSFNADLLDFVNKRTTAAFRRIPYRNRRLDKRYKAFENRAKELHREICRRLGGTTEAWELFDEYESAENLLAGIEIDQAYLQGLSDGFRLKNLLDRR